MLLSVHLKVCLYLNYVNPAATFSSGSTLIARPPSRPPPIKPDDNQPVVRPAEESPPASFGSCRGSFGDAPTHALVASESFVVPPPGRDVERLLQPTPNVFSNLLSRDDCAEFKEGIGIESHDQDIENSSKDQKGKSMLKLHC